tara:strand:+ start:119 stop:709 length:591 start_codon:yes stop_codon:yes gene_type:complete
MAFTRFHDEPCRIEKLLQESTDPCKYVMNVPGNGLKPCFMEDPYIRMQKWGSNLQTNSVNLESELLGMTRPYSRDNIDKNDYQKHKHNTSKINYPTCKPITHQPRATNPAWTLKGVEQHRWNILPMDPQKTALVPFTHELSSRIIQKDQYTTEVPCIPENNNSEECISFSNSGTSASSPSSSASSWCLKTNSCGSV